MRSLCLFLMSLFILTGCTTFSSPAPAPLPAPAQTPEPAVAPVALPDPVTPESLAQGFVEALARGDIEGARTYCLSPQEFDALFSWAGPADPRPEMAARMDGALDRAAAALYQAKFQRVVEVKPVATLQEGRQLASLTLDQPVQAIDNISVLVDMGGAQRRFQIDGLLQADGKWRIFSPTFRLV